MSLNLDDTIAAIASAPGGAARGVVRVSGQDALAIVARLVDDAVERQLTSVATARRMDTRLALRAGRLKLPADLLLWPTAKSYTREPIVEVHTLGSPPLLEAVLQAICAAGARLARPGEFTLRAFLAGRLDMTQAEAVLGVIDARDRREFAVALGQLGGGLARPLSALRSRLLDLLADLEAGLDFVEEDIAFIEREDLERQLAEAAAIVDDLLRRLSTRAVLAGEPRVVLAGLPNAGKSSLFNALAVAEAAIVSPQAGTTRDYVTRRLDLDGIACQLIDTAGLEFPIPTRSVSEDNSPAPISISDSAQSHSRLQTEQADLTMHCRDANSPPPTAAELDTLNAAIGRVILVWTQCDRLANRNERAANRDLPSVETSALTGEGISKLRAEIRDALLAQQSAAAEVVASTAARCGDSLRGSSDALARARQLAQAGQGDELVAAELRAALHELGLVVGAVHTDDLLDRIFSRFCIGK